MLPSQNYQKKFPARAVVENNAAVQEAYEELRHFSSNARCGSLGVANDGSLRIIASM